MSTSQVRILVICLWLIAAAWFFLPPGAKLISKPAAAGTNSTGAESFWFKGNTHSHARISVGEYIHGDSSPREVANWYRDHGYHFLVITDHNRYENAQELSSDESERHDFLVLPGMEITSDYLYPGVNQRGERRIHSSAINIGKAVEWDFDDPNKAKIIDQQASRSRMEGGLHILNHPNYRFQIELKDILAAENVRLFEMYNAHPRSNHAGHAGFRPGVEALWDQVLSSGRLLYGVAADDAHDFNWHRQMLRRFGSAPPGGAWTMVRAAALNADGIVTALETGDFYSSTGVHLKSISISDDEYSIEIDRERTIEETRHKWVRDAAPVVFSDDSHFVIEFIGLHGRVLQAAHDHDQASIRLNQGQVYVRARVTYLDKKKSFTGADKARAFFAWTQPVMTRGKVSDQ